MTDPDDYELQNEVAKRIMAYAAKLAEQANASSAFEASQTDEEPESS